METLSRVLACGLPAIALALGSCSRPWGGGGGSLDDDSAAAADAIDDDDGDDDTAGLDPVGLACTPEESPLVHSYGQEATVQLGLQAQWSDGSWGPPAGPVTWTVPADFGGSVDEQGVYTVPGNHGGQVDIVAWYGTLSATCSLELILEIWVDATGQVGDAAEEAGTFVNDSCAPVIVYPLAGSLLPRELPAPTFQWTAGPGQNTWVLTLANTYASATMITSSTSIKPAPFIWYAIADSTAGDQVTATVAGGNWDGSGFAGGLCVGSTSLQFMVGSFGLEGTVFYWSPATQGLWRIDVGAEVAEPWLGPSNAGWCVGCHSVNLHDSGRMAMNFGGGNQWSVVSDLLTPLPPLMGPEIRRGNFTALDPTGTLMVRSYGGVLHLDDLGLGVEVGIVPTTGFATHPDWSADGTRITYASCAWADENYDWQPHECGIGVLEVLPGGGFGATTTILPADSSYSYYYPSFSPDGAWIVLNRAPHGVSSYDNPDAEVMIVPSAGGTPILLAAANGGAGLTNSWPRWSPTAGTTAWVAFGSRRPYGLVTSGMAQIWVAAVDLAVAGSGPDPSYPPFWLPGQDPAVGNHTPVWAPRYVEPE